MFIFIFLYPIRCKMKIGNLEWKIKNLCHIQKDEKIKNNPYFDLITCEKAGIFV